MAVTLGKIYEVAIRSYHMQLKAGEKGLYRLVDWVHMVEEMDYVQFLKGRELIVTTGIIMPGEEKLLHFVENICTAGASGLVINTGHYIKQIPDSLLEFANEHDFPIFTLPWEVHLVDFNRELCNLIYQAEREQDNLESAVKKLVFSEGEIDHSLQILEKEGVTEETAVRLLQCSLPISDKGGSGETSQEVTQLYYRFQRHCQQVLSAKKKKYVLFYQDLFVVIVVFDMPMQQVEEAAGEILGFQSKREKDEQMSLMISGADTSLRNLSQKYKAGHVLCKKCRMDGKAICREDEIGVWKLLLEVEDHAKLKRYEETLLGELEHLDEENGTEYCAVLEAYLEGNGNIQEVAARCFLHRNTVSAHLKRIAEITGRSLMDAGDRNELYLAFQIRKILQLM